MNLSVGVKLLGEFRTSSIWERSDHLGLRHIIHHVTDRAAGASGQKCADNRGALDDEAAGRHTFSIPSVLMGLAVCSKRVGGQKKTIAVPSGCREDQWISNEGSP